MRAFEAPRARAQPGDGEAGRVVDEEWHRGKPLARLDEAVEVLARHLALADVVGRHARFLGQDARRELLGRHFEREEADARAVLGLQAAVAKALRPEGAGGVEADVGRDRRLAHRRPPGDHHEVGRMEPAQKLVEIDISGRDAGRAAGALEGGLGLADRLGERRFEFAEPALEGAGRRQLEQLALRLLDLLRRFAVEIVARRRR